MIEIGSHEVFSEMNDSEVGNRDVVFEHVSKCVNCALRSEGLFNVT